MRDGAFKQNCLIVLAAAALLLNALLPFYAVYDPQVLAEKMEKTVRNGGFFSLPGEKILICTAEGFKWVTAQDLQNGEEQPEQHPRIKCPLCYLAVFGIKHTPPALTAALDRPPAHIDALLQPHGNTLISGPNAAQGYHSRAPPAA